MRTDERIEHDTFVEHLHDPGWFVPRLSIITKAGQVRRLDPLFPEQAACVLAFRTHHNNLVEKPRQIGSTTVWVALFFWMMLTAGSAYDVLAIMHEYTSVSRFTRQVRHHIRHLPRCLRPHVLIENTKEVRFKVGKHESSFCTTMAGGRGQGRSYTFRGALFSEVGRYPRGSSAQGGEGAIDQSVYASITSTMPTPEVDPLTRIVLESTPGPPTGLFYDLVNRAQSPEATLGWEDEKRWAFQFFPWFKFPQYRMKWPAGLKLTADETTLLTAHRKDGLTIENLAWRRYMIDVKNYSDRMFRQEYPSTWQDPFLLTTSMWFNLEKITEIRAKLPRGRSTEVVGERIHVKFSAGHTYFIGSDASGGTGGDFATAHVLRDDGVECAVWSANDKSPRDQADHLAKLSARYGKAIVNVECGNMYGRAVWTRLRELGVPLWRDEEGREFVTDPRNKAQIMDWMKHCIENGFATLNDAATIEECMHIREQLRTSTSALNRTGNIGADPGYHDDHVVGFALGLWAARRTMTSRWRSEQPNSTLDVPGQQMNAMLLGKGAEPWKR